MMKPNVRRNLTGLTLLLTLLSGQGVAAQQDLQQIYAEAKRAEAAGDLSTAALRYEEIVKLQPRMAEAYANLGNIYYQQSKTDQAAAAYGQALKLKPDLAGPQFFLGVISFGTHDYGAALRHLQRAAALQPKNPLIDSYLGYTLYARSEFRSATAALEKAADLDPKNIDVLYHLNKAYGHLANDAYRLLQDRFGDSVYGALARAHAYESQENWKAASEQYALAHRMLPANQSLRARGDWAAAKANGNNASMVDIPSDPLIDGSLAYRDVKLSGADLAQQIQQWQKTVHSFEKENGSAEQIYEIAEGYQVLGYFLALAVFDADADSYRTHQLRAQLFETSDKDEEAIAEYRIALKQKPDLQNIHFAIGSLLWKNQSFEPARTELLEELKLNPNHPQALYELGDIAAFSNDDQGALKYLNAALRLDPSIVEAHLTLEKVYTQRGEYEKSLEQLKEVLALVPSDAKVHYRLSAVYRKMGKIPDADRELAVYSQMNAASKRAQ